MDKKLEEVLKKIENMVNDAPDLNLLFEQFPKLQRIDWYQDSIEVDGDYSEEEKKKIAKLFVQYFNCKEQ